MRVLSFRKLCEENFHKDRLGKQLSGQIMSEDEFFRPEVMEAFDRSHGGLYMFVAFHPTSDIAMRDYVLQGTLGSDVGPSILALFTTDRQAMLPQPVTKVLSAPALGVAIDDREHLSHGFVRMVFPNKAVPGFPGLLIFHRFSMPVEPVYIHLPNQLDKQAIQACVHEISRLATEALGSLAPSDTLAAELSKRLAKTELGYLRGGRTSATEWLFKVLKALKPFKKDIVTAIASKVSAGLVGGKGHTA